MKKATSLIVLGLCGLSVSALIAANFQPSPSNPPAAGKSALPPAPAATLPYGSTPSEVPTPTPAPPPTTTKIIDSALPRAPLPPDLADSKAIEKAIEAHIKPARTPVPIATPPPAPRPEKKTIRINAGYVWVPGYYRPVDSKWQWTQGEWSAPATPASVWIEPNYDAKTKVWTAGYWQPDRPDSYEAVESAVKEPPLPPSPAVK